MISHAELMRRCDNLTRDRAIYIQNIQALENQKSALETQIAQQRTFLANVEGSLAMVNDLIPASEAESARLHGMIKGLQRGVISLEDITFVDNDLKIDIKTKTENADGVAAN